MSCCKLLAYYDNIHNTNALGYDPSNKATSLENFKYVDYEDYHFMRSKPFKKSR
jgi:hypothetical protein